MDNNLPCQEYEKITSSKRQSYEITAKNLKALTCIEANAREIKSERERNTVKEENCQIHYQGNISTRICISTSAALTGHVPDRRHFCTGN